MTMKLSTTLQHVNIISHSVNAKVVKEFYEYLKGIGTSENYQDQNLKQVAGFARFLGGGKTFTTSSRRRKLFRF
ncbi:MAG TPA: hypothetical protein VFR61_07755 [Nitrososphaeraceae archaeon]|nr:hypothetical protein [Nitrososphaeraceae archaeon]